MWICHEKSGNLNFRFDFSSGGCLAVTDANLVLGRLIPKYFPHIFGETEDQPLDAESSKRAFEELTTEVSKVIEIFWEHWKCQFFFKILILR